MRVHELFEADIPPLGQPTRSATQTKAELTSLNTPFRWKVTVVKGGEEDDVTHEFTALGGRDQAEKVAKKWFKDTFGRKPRSGEYFIDSAPRIASVGSGAFSDVRLHPNQHEVVRRERYPGDDRGGQAWTNAVIKYNETNPLGNPWLPYITELRTVTDPDQVTRMQTTQGRLESGFSLSLEALESIANRIFPNFSASLTPAISQQAKPAMHWDAFVRMIAGILVNPSLASDRTIEKKVKGQFVEVPNPYYTEDENMLEALALVNQTATKYRVEYDLHDENIMLRNTGRGWQPVITDPLA